MAPSQAMSALTPTETVQALELIKKEWNDPPVECHYLMQVAHQVYLLRKQFEIFVNSFSKTPVPAPEILPMKGMKLEFKFGEKEPEAETKADGFDQKAVDTSKLHWMAGVGLRKDGTRRPTAPGRNPDGTPAKRHPRSRKKK